MKHATTYLNDSAIYIPPHIQHRRELVWFFLRVAAIFTRVRDALAALVAERQLGE